MNPTLTITQTSQTERTVVTTKHIVKSKSMALGDTDLVALKDLGFFGYVSKNSEMTIHRGLRETINGDAFYTAEITLTSDR